jgi:hypothetical protein
MEILSFHPREFEQAENAPCVIFAGLFSLAISFLIYLFFKNEKQNQ